MQTYLTTIWIWYWLSKEEIKKIYREKAMAVHPDRNTNMLNSEKLMIEINCAYDYIIENFDDYVNNVKEIRETAISILSEWIYIFYVQKDYELALEKLEKSLKLNKNYLNTLMLKVKCLEKLWKQEDALKEYDMIIKNNVDYSQAYYAKSILLDNMWRYKESKEIYDKYIVKFWWFYSSFKKWNELLEQWKYIDALKMYDRAIELNPKFKDVYEKKIWVLKILWRDKEALELSNRNNKIDTNNDEYIKTKFDNEILQPANKEIENNNYVSALELLDNWIFIFPTNIELYILKWKCYFEMMKYELAIDTVDYIVDTLANLIESNNKYKEELYNLKWICLYKLWKYEEAMEYFDILLLLKWNKDEVFNRAKILFTNGWYNKAIKLLTRAITLDQNNIDISYEMRSTWKDMR